MGRSALSEGFALTFCLRVGPALTILAFTERTLITAFAGGTVVAFAEGFALAIGLGAGPAFAVVTLAELALFATFTARAASCVAARRSFLVIVHVALAFQRG
ncbi:hypothetical protein HK436_01695 [Mesorhizobium sediminum]|uniref:hypothetical protein n=1 Tax=Neoaquamicrobium sediminum TaxID=1849104 RepID=UPI001DF1B54B|nr:hypothetical protein [Mesorhizobium sediminum]NRC52640.1 hypothetical protein [Mesorhizobium sediminum]